LFWKKRKPASDSGRVPKIENPQGDRDQREAFRYQFKPEDRISMSFLGQPVMVLNISARGMAFINKGFSKYDVDLIQLDLDIPRYRGDTRLSAALRIIYIGDDQTCHCIFENCTIDQYELIHKYVLEMQKKELRHRPHDPAH
jgi:hypothetical protein